MTLLLAFIPIAKVTNDVAIPVIKAFNSQNGGKKGRNVGGQENDGYPWTAIWRTRDTFNLPISKWESGRHTWLNQPSDISQLARGWQCLPSGPLEEYSRTVLITGLPSENAPVVSEVRTPFYVSIFYLIAWLPSSRNESEKSVGNWHCSKFTAGAFW